MSIKKMFMIIFGIMLNINSSSSIGFAVQGKDFTKSDLISKSSTVKLKNNTNFSLLLYANHWRKIQNFIFFGGHIGAGISNKNFTHKTNLMDLKMGNNNIHLDSFVNLGFGDKRTKIYFGTGVIFNRLTPKISYLEYKIDENGTKLNTQIMSDIVFHEKNLLIPFFAFKTGVDFFITDKIGLNLHYIYGIARTNRLESNSAHTDIQLEFDKEKFRFKPRINRIGLGIHFKIA